MDRLSATLQEEGWKVNSPATRPSQRDFCVLPRRIEFRYEPRIEVKILPTTRHTALARASVTMIANEVVPLGDFIIFEQDGKVVVAGPLAVRLNYRLGKRVEQAVLAAWNERNTMKGRRNEDRSGNPAES